jgi:CRP/FNR family cyclic AMP-dependent transcriptional regulator
MPSKKSRAFDVEAFLESAGLGRRLVTFARNDVVYSQGDAADSVMYLRSGGVQLAVVSHAGKEAVVGTLRPGDFLGEGALAGQPLRLASARATIDSTVLVITKRRMQEVLRSQRGLSDRFIGHMLVRNARLESDLIDQLFNSSEKRLARALLLLAHYGTRDRPQRVLPPVSQEILAEMIGTTRSRVNFFLNKFRKLGFIEYDAEGLTVDSSLLTVVVHE